MLVRYTLDYNFIVKCCRSFTIIATHAYVFYVDTTNLADGTYELIPESESEQREAIVNLTEVVEDLN
jgi:hypothetical protein